MRGCKGFLRKICGDVNNPVHSAKCRKLMKHLDRCKDCTVYMDTLKKMIHLYQEYPDPKVPSRTHKRLYATLQLEYSKPKGKARQKTRSRAKAAAAH